MNSSFDVNSIRIESEKVLEKHGLSEEDSRIVIDTMLEADMAGISSHGICMLPTYIDKIENGYFSMEFPAIIKSTESFAVVDARNTIGVISANYCTKLVGKRAKKAGMYTVFSRNCNTFGTASYFTNKLAEDGLIGIVFSNFPAAMPVANGVEPKLGTNTVAFSCPSKSYGAIVIDTATSAVAKSKFGICRSEGKELPDGWDLNSAENPTNYSLSGIKGLVLPMAGFKGCGIAMIIDILSGALSGAVYLNKDNKFYSKTNEPMNVGYSFIAIDPSAVYDDDFLSLMDEYIERVREFKPAEGKTIIVPGDRRKLEKKRAEENDISFTSDSINKLVKILISGNATEIDFLNKFSVKGGYEITYHKNEWEQVDNPESFDIVVCNNLFKYNSIEKFASLKFIQLTSAGMDRVPMEYVHEKGIRISNAKGVYDIPIAEYTVGRILQWYKRFRNTDESVARHRWEKQRRLQELKGKTVIIFGYGGIGHEIALRLKGFGIYIIGVSRTERIDEVLDEWRSPDRMSDVLKLADIFIIAAPLTEETRGFVNRPFISHLKQECVLINISRGPIVNTSHLIEAIQNGNIAGAILDVYEEEPIPAYSKLWSVKNVMLSPHNSFEGEGNTDRLEQLIVNNILREVRFI